MQERRMSRMVSRGLIARGMIPICSLPQTIHSRRDISRRWWLQFVLNHCSILKR
ncbi:uncharacterized protein B0H18DRAFT_989994 [Fomitopsis serialis]|uniref:uncharacterized protein n=1 Tax=Fomitopsis serialis TaxID=139415 RepID=UPI002008AE76|nr:uncharacterized protein B0H18DRAFT_989994 [Neoantrodia serialis]KAH9931568.1 hypothetical protein B0H18DRAFT_989994 [Neoantrodia serialis]